MSEINRESIYFFGTNFTDAVNLGKLWLIVRADAFQFEPVSTSTSSWLTIVQPEPLDVAVIFMANATYQPMVKFAFDYVGIFLCSFHSPLIAWFTFTGQHMVRILCQK